MFWELGLTPLYQPNPVRPAARCYMPKSNSARLAGREIGRSPRFFRLRDFVRNGRAVASGSRLVLSLHDLGLLLDRLRRRRLRRADPFKRQDALAGRPFKVFLELLCIVRHQFGAVPRPADLDIENLLRGQVRVARFCTSSEHFGPKEPGFKRVPSSSGFLQATLC